MCAGGRAAHRRVTPAMSRRLGSTRDGAHSARIEDAVPLLLWEARWQQHE